MSVCHYQLHSRLYWISAVFPLIVFHAPESSPGNHIALACHASPASSGMLQYLSLPCFDLDSFEAYSPDIL